MNLADWLDKDHASSERYRMAASLCRVVAENGGSPLNLDPSRIPVSGSECHPEEGRGAPNGVYRAPETSEGQTAGAQAQVYTVGVLCFEILGGRSFQPRGGPLLRDVRPDLPRDVTDAVQACLEMDAEWRPKDVAYLQGLVEAQSASGASSSKSASKSAPRSSARPAAAAAPTPRSARRGEPAPRPWPLILFAVAALVVSGAIAVIRLRQPIAAPSLPPAPTTVPAASPVAVAAETAPVPAPVTTTRPGGTTAAAEPTRRPSAAPAATVPAVVSPAPVVPGTKLAARANETAEPAAAARPPAAAVTAPPPVVAAATPPPVTAAPAAPPSTEAAAAPAESAAPAAVTQVSPPVLHRGAATLIDVHGVGMRSEHQVRLARGREPAKGIDVVKQRFVNATLLQVLLKVDATASPGAYTLVLVDAAGQVTNPRPFEIAK